MPWSRDAKANSSVVVLAEKQMPVFAAEQEPEPGQILAQLPEVVALAALKPHLISRHDAQYRPQGHIATLEPVSSTNRWRDVRVATTARIRRSPRG